MDTELSLRIGGIIIEFQSDFPLEHIGDKEKSGGERFNNFFYRGRSAADIIVRVNITEKLPEVRKTQLIFITYHFQNGSENWRMLKKGNTYIYKCPLKDREQVMLVNSTFDRVDAYLLPKRDRGRVWNISDIIYDFLQVLLINYLAQRKSGVFAHAIGVKDINGKGLLFAGKSGCGKTVTARLWHRYSRAVVLNDDRIIVRKANKFYIYGSPWHGEFSDYLLSRIESAPLERLFFIYPAKCNTVRQISKKEAFRFLYPALFPTFWDRKCLENIVSFSQELIQSVPCYHLGFVDNRDIIRFVRKI